MVSGDVYLCVGANVVTYPTRDGLEFIANLSLALDEMYSVMEKQ